MVLPADGLAQDEPAEQVDAPLKQDGVEVTERGMVELHVADQPLADVLQLLSLKGKRNIIASPNVVGSVTANLYGVTYEEALEAILLPNGAGYRTVGRFTYVYTNDELEQQAIDATGGRETKVIVLSYINAKDAASYVSPLLAEGETVTASPEPEVGIDSDASTGGGNKSAANDFLVVTARPDRIARVEALIKQIDTRPRQVLIEATILRAELKDENALGIDFSIVGGVDLELLDATSNGIQDLSLGQLPVERLEQFNSIAATAFMDAVPGGGLTLGIVKDHVAVFLRALEQVTDTTVLANPKVLALNKQKGQVIVGRRDGYLTTTITETQSVQTVEFLETGTQLLYRPFIGNDDWVRMELHPEDSVGFVNAQGLPSEQTTEVTTNVMVRDGQTILIGGLFREVTTSANGQVPIAGNLPGIGPLFRSKNDTTSREEVIILLTVSIVKNQDAYAAESSDAYEDVERVRIGSRRGLMWHGRERFAQAQYRKGLDRWAQGDADKALWHTSLAISCYPRLLPAIRFKEQILGQRDWDVEASLSRGFLFKLVAKEKGYQHAMFGRPAPAPQPGPPVEPENSEQE